MLEARNLVVRFGERIVLNHVSLKLPKGSFLGISGKSGAGKSTFLKALGGYMVVESGEVFFDEKRFPDAKNLLLPGFDGIQMVQQDFHIDPFHTVRENIRESILHFPNDLRERRVNQLLKQFHLQHLSENKAILLSGGEKQRLALIRAIAPRPKIVLLDEPFSQLDQRLRIELTGILNQLRQKEQMSFLLVAHDPADLLGMCDQIAILKNGRLSKFQNVEDVYYQTKNSENARLLGPLNTLEMNEQRVHFRPDEYEIVAENGIEIYFERAVFVGSWYINFLRTKKNESLILYSFNPLNAIRQIKISPKKLV